MATLIIVEDNYDNAVVAKQFIRRWAKEKKQELSLHIIEGSDQLFTLLEQLTAQRQEVDLILLDIQLPGEDGFKILEQLRDHKSYCTIKVLALTANVMQSDIEKARAAGFNGFIGKPIKRESFIDAIQKGLNGEFVWLIH